MKSETMVPRISPRQLEREALRALPYLQREGAFLAHVPRRSIDVPKDLGVYLTAKQAKPTLKIEVGIVREFIASDWLQPASAQRYVITAAGIAWLKRAGEDSQPLGPQNQQRRLMNRALPDGRVGKVMVNDGESPLGWLRRRCGKHGQPMLTNEQFQAGERLRSDFTKAQLMPSTTASWSGFHGRRSRRSGGAGRPTAEISEIALTARHRTQSALGALSLEMAGLVVDVCCLLVGLEEAERQRKWSRRSAKIVLGLALTELARHYGYLKQPPAQRRQTIRNWGAENYRPSMFGQGEETD